MCDYGVYADLYTDKGGNQQLKRNPYRKCGLIDLQLTFSMVILTLSPVFTSPRRLSSVVM